MNGVSKLVNAIDVLETYATEDIPVREPAEVEQVALEAREGLLAVETLTAAVKVLMHEYHGQDAQHAGARSPEEQDVYDALVSLRAPAVVSS